MVDEGTSDGSFTPVSGIISGKDVQIINPVTSGKDSRYDLSFVPASTIPKNGFITITIPPELQLRPTEVLSDGVCTSATLTCTSVENNIITIKTTEVISAGS